MKTLPWLMAVLALAGCARGADDALPGYVEADYVRLAAPIGGTLAHLHVQRGDTVAAGAPAFVLEQDNERAAREEAQARVAQADLRETQAAIVRERDAITVLGAEWARLTQPARIQALTERHLDLSDRPAVELSALTDLPSKAQPAPEETFSNAKAVVPAPATPEQAPATPQATVPAVMHTGT